MKIATRTPNTTNLKNNTAEIISTSVPTFSAIASTLGIFGNVLALIVLVKSAKIHKWKVFYKTIAILAIIDLLGILTTSPIVIAVYLGGMKWVGGQGLCNYFSVMLIFSGLTTCLFIGVMALDRYMAIVFPFKYRTLPKDKLAKYMIAGVLLFSAFVSFLPVFGLGQNMVHYPGSWCFPNFHDHSIEDAIFSYFYSCLIILSVSMTACLNIWAVIRLIIGKRSQVRRGSNTNNSKTKKHRDVYIMVLLVVIFVVFAVCWMPFVVCILISQISEDLFDKEADLLALRLASFNQILDPWVYLLFRRETLKKFLLYVVRQKTNGENMLARFLSINSQRTFQAEEVDGTKKIFITREIQNNVVENPKSNIQVKPQEVTEL